MLNGLKAKLQADRPVMGALAFLPSADVVEVLAVAGFDYVIIDLEHTATNSETAVHMVRAAQVHGMSPLIRVRENSEKLILQALEMGAEGIVVPFVQSRDDVIRAARAIRYLPDGVRGTCTASRASRYGTLRTSFLEHTQAMNNGIVLVGLIEDMNGVNAISEILDCDPGLDAVLVGRSDLSASIGQMGKWDHPAVIDATMRTIKAAAQHQSAVRAGIVFGGPDETRHWLDAGCRFLCYGTDSDLLLSAAARAKQAFTDATLNVPARATSSAA